MILIDVIATIRRDQEKKNDTEAHLQRIKYLMLELNIIIFRINVGKWNEEEFNQCHLDKVFYDENSISYAVMH